MDDGVMDPMAPQDEAAMDADAEVAEEAAAEESAE